MVKKPFVILRKKLSFLAYRVIAVDFNLVARRKKSVEAHDELRVASEQAGDPSDHSGRVDALAFELLHDVEEVVVDLRLVAEAELDLVEVGERVLDLEALEVGAVGVVVAAAVVGAGRSWRK